VGVTDNRGKKSGLMKAVFSSRRRKTGEKIGDQEREFFGYMGKSGASRERLHLRQRSPLGSFQENKGWLSKGQGGDKRTKGEEKTSLHHYSVERIKTGKARERQEGRSCGQNELGARADFGQRRRS